jgi:methylenetetrahydrofolate reductase (NADPH)
MDPLMEFKPPFIDVVTTSREEFIYVDKGNGLLDKTNQNAPWNTWDLCFNKT